MVPLPNERRPDWVADYIGIPFLANGRERSGCDCYGLVRLVIRERLGLALPGYADDYQGVDDRAAIAGLVHADLDRMEAVPCEVQPFRSRGVERLGDVIVLRWKGQPVHMGVVVARGQMLHTYRKAESCCVEYSDAVYAWLILGIHRFPGLADG